MTRNARASATKVSGSRVSGRGYTCVGHRGDRDYHRDGNAMISTSELALVLAAGHTFRSGVMNGPVNVAVVPSKHGMRGTLLTGYSLR
jgi:hypothetical protein